jgi:hypothetical protein
VSALAPTAVALVSAAHGVAVTIAAESLVASPAFEAAIGVGALLSATTTLELKPVHAAIKVAAPVAASSARGTHAVSTTAVAWSSCNVTIGAAVSVEAVAPVAQATIFGFVAKTKFEPPSARLKRFAVEAMLRRR